MDDLAANWGLTRSVATEAQGTVTFIKYSSPTTTIKIGNTDGSGGVVVSTVKDSNGNYYSFTTTSTVYLTSSNYNSATGQWEVSAPIEALVAGIDSNVSANSITAFTGVSGIDAITNKTALTNGTAEESNTTLATRIAAASQARLLGTAPGYDTLVDAVVGVDDAVVITPGEAESIRNSDGNEIDVVILGSDLTSTTDSVVFDKVNGLCYTFISRPVDSITAVAGAGISISFIENVDFVLVPDTNSEYYNTVDSYDKLVWLNTGNQPYNGGTYNVNYLYNKLVFDVQAILDDEDNKLLASNIYARAGTEVLVDIALSAAVFSGTDLNYAKSQIETTLTNYINALGLAESIEQSDLVFELRDKLTFVDNIVLPFTKLCRRSVGTGVSDLTATKLEYFRVDSNSFTVTVV
jgi:hypothetical protein